MPMHWNELWAHSASPNEVTSDERDPISKQPALKCCAVAVGPYVTPRRVDDERTEDSLSSPGESAVFPYTAA